MNINNIIGYSALMVLWLFFSLGVYATCHNHSEGGDTEEDCTAYYILMFGWIVLTVAMFWATRHLFFQGE